MLPEIKRGAGVSLAYRGGEGGFLYRGAPSVYRSSRSHHREFFPHCGTQLMFRRSMTPETIDVTLASLDDPSVIAPQYHIWMQSKIDWLRIDDTLPCFDDGGPAASPDGC
ncbi:GFA family protein [Oceanisphaera sp. KMM 10153]|uniref:GFA family protein n=1 Tax=Oceanisphaera submarina TaxID=3390193 RepID=UPI003974FED0